MPLSFCAFATHIMPQNTHHTPSATISRGLSEIKGEVCQN